MLASLGELFEEATRRERKNNFHVVSSVPPTGRPSYLSQPGLADPKCFQMSSNSDLSPGGPDHTSTPPPHPSAPCSPLTEPPHGRTAHPHQPPHLEPIKKETVREREREREREWGGGPVKLELAGIAVWSLLQPLPLKKTLFLCIAAPYSNNYFAFWSSCVVNLRGKWIQLPCKNKKSYYNDGHMGYGLMCRLVQITYHF